MSTCVDTSESRLGSIQKRLFLFFIAPNFCLHVLRERKEGKGPEKGRFAKSRLFLLAREVFPAVRMDPHPEGPVGLVDARQPKGAVHHGVLMRRGGKGRVFT